MVEVVEVTVLVASGELGSKVVKVTRKVRKG